MPIFAPICRIRHPKRPPKNIKLWSVGAEISWVWCGRIIWTVSKEHRVHGRDIHSVRLCSFFLNWDLAGVLIQSDCGFNGIFILIIFENQSLNGIWVGFPVRASGSARNVMTPWPCRWALGRWAFCFGEGVDGFLTKEDVDFTENKTWVLTNKNRDVAKFFSKKYKKSGFY